MLLWESVGWEQQMKLAAGSISVHGGGDGQRTRAIMQLPGRSDREMRRRKRLGLDRR